MAHDPSPAQQSAYQQSGVDIEAGHRAVALMKDAVSRSQHAPGLRGQVLSGLGGFGGLFRPGFAGLQDPVLVASTDGVGTKTKVASLAGVYGGLGHDIVNHCTNDLLVQGARPLFFLDYIAMGKLVPEAVAEFVKGAALACEGVGAALLGGETAEMPGVYVEGELDIVGTLVGVVDRPALVTGERLEAGDAVIALPSTGLHTNGYSLARRVLDGLDWNEPRPDLGGSLQNALLAPHRSYLAAFEALLSAGLDIRGMAHITGGGLIDNPPRIFPDGLGMQVDVESWTLPPLFRLIVERGQVTLHDAFHALNMGVGFLFMVPAAQLTPALEALRAAGEQPWQIGQMVPGQGVQLSGSL
ncbi:phosphoribosylformylglycinamidine cyclo-ligase [Deinococcus sp. KNUC1210]|uniref:phosphoribosylformylglycinamidine cyclo-ligase n=1 Tax=Deinococcus sp. KNUC1210 TaxID=2917691 RepID=UPI001EF0C240|nr:phosphoribosylformylglycinamidine cyclo-ligase [Deinococcus sp. KNUC1210]ULH15355.1 phosphoribosylformylglycinamidine cyclo-ligase [Deinococcus sp. KNUC1210]